MPKSKSKKTSFNPAIVFPYFGLAFLTVIAGGLITVNITSLVSKQNVLAASSNIIEGPSQEQLKEEQSFWLQVVKENPTYRDGFIELWDIENKLGNKLQAQEYINQAKKVDPNSSVIPLLESRLY